MFSTLLSIKDIAGLTPKNAVITGTRNVNGAFTPIIYTVPQDCLFILKHAQWYFTSGTANGNAFNVSDGTTSYQYYPILAPVVNTIYNFSGEVISEAGSSISVYWGVTANPMAYVARISGILVKDGEGVLD